MSNENDRIITFKIIVVGNYQTGKTSLTEKYVNDVFNTRQQTTIGVDFKTKYIDCGNDSIKLHIWDTAGQERFMTIVSSYYRTINGIVLVFDITDKDSFNDLQKWMKQIIFHKDDKQIQIILVGNKADLNQDAISNDEILAFVQTSPYPMSYIKTSAKSGLNVERVFLSLVDNLYVEHIKHNAKEKNPIELQTTMLKQNEVFKYGCC